MSTWLRDDQRKNEELTYI